MQQIASCFLVTHPSHVAAQLLVLALRAECLHLGSLMNVTDHGSARLISQCLSTASNVWLRS